MNTIENWLLVDPERAEQIRCRICRFISSHMKSAGCKGVVVGLSGGLDSALVAFLCVEALGKENVMGIHLPAKSSKKEDERDAQRIAEILGIRFQTIAIEGIVDEFIKVCPAKDKVARGNICSRTRMVILRDFASSRNALLVGTGNRSELEIGYFTKCGDGGVDILPIGALYKTQIRQLAGHMGVPSGILNKDPSAGLWKGQTDESEMGISYHDLDRILMSLSRSHPLDAIASKTDIEHVLSMKKAASHKLEMPPVAQVD